MGEKKHIALVAHDNKKPDLLEWATYNRETLTQHQLYATGTTGALLERELGIEIHKLHTANEKSLAETRCELNQQGAQP